MVTLRGNPKTGIQKTINFDDEGEGTTQVTKLSEEEHERLRQKFLEEQRERERTWRSEPTKNRKRQTEPPKQSEAQKQPHDHNLKQPQHQKQQQIQPQLQDLAKQLSSFRETEEKFKAQGLTKRQRRKAWPGGRSHFKSLTFRDKAERKEKAKLTELSTDSASKLDSIKPTLSSGSHHLPPNAKHPLTARRHQVANVMSNGANARNIIENPAASAAHQRARNYGQSFAMDEPEESRTAALGRKRKKGGDLRDQLAADKRRRLSAGERSGGDDDWADDSMSISEGSNNDGSKESGEVSSGDEEERDEDDYARAASSKAPVNAARSRASTGAKSRTSPIIISSDGNGDDDVQIIPPPTSNKRSDPKTLTLDDLEPPQLKIFMTQEMAQHPEGTSVQAVLQNIIEHGNSYVKPARKFMSRWEQEVKEHRSGAKAVSDPTWAPEDVRDIQAAFEKRLFSRDMNLDDLQIKPGLQKHMKASRIANADLFPTLCKIAINEEAFHGQARKVLAVFSKQAYVGPKMTRLGIMSAPKDASKQMGQERRQSAELEAPSVGEAPEVEMEEELPGLDSDRDSEAKSDDPSVGESPAGQSFDYGSLARNAAGVTPLNGHARPSLVRMHEISDDEQVLQYRYYRITDPNALVRCLCCGELGHLEDDCPEQTCSRCGAQGDHFSHNCPNYSKCRRCRQRGHSAGECRNRLTQPSGPSDPCDVCGRVGHVEEECERLWCTFTIKDKDIVKVPQDQMIKACYNCGGSDHFGDDCPKLPNYAQGSQDGRVWSDFHANRFLQIEKEPARHYGHGYNYQMAHFDDMRD